MWMSPAAATFLCAIAGALVFLLFTFLLQYFSRTCTTYKSEEREREREKERCSFSTDFSSARVQISLPPVPCTRCCANFSSASFFPSIYRRGSSHHRLSPANRFKALWLSYAPLESLRRLIDALFNNPLTTAHFVTHRSYHTAGIVLRCAPRTANFWVGMHNI